MGSQTVSPVFQSILADGNDIAAAGFLDLGGLLAADGVQTAELVGAGGTDIAKGHIGSDLAAHDLNEAVLAELVGNGLEYECESGCCGVYIGSGDIVANCLQNCLGADVSHCCAADNGNDAAIFHAELDAGNDIGLAKLHLLKVLLHKLLGSACGGLHKSLTKLCYLVGICCGNGDLCCLAALGLVCNIVYQIDNAGAVGHGSDDGADDAAVLCLKVAEDLVEITVLLVELGDVEHCGDIGSLQILPAALSTDGNAVLCRAEDNAGICDTDCGEDIADKVEVPRAVKHIDLAAAEIDGCNCSRDSDLALDLFCVVVTDGVAVGHLALTVDSAGSEQHAFGKAGLAAVAVTYKANVTDVFGFVAHVLLPL